MSETITLFSDITPLETPYLSLLFLNKIPLDELRKIIQLTKLQHLNASSEEIVDTHLEIISQVSSIELLDLDVSEITDAGIPFIIPLQNLKALRLKDNPQLTDACIPHLAKLKDLKSIHLGNTSVTIDGLETLCSQLQLEEVILNYRFEDFVSKLKQISKAHPQLSILIKGTGTIKNGEMQ